MNKIIKTIIAVLGGMDATISIIIPLVVAILWVTVTGLTDWTSYLFYGMGLLATLFRAIKIGGWLK